MTNALISGTFTGTGQSKSASVYGPFNFSVWGTPLNGDGTADTYSGTVELDRSFDGGTTWLAVAALGRAASFIFSGNKPKGSNIMRGVVRHIARGVVRGLMWNA